MLPGFWFANIPFCLKSPSAAQRLSAGSPNTDLTDARVTRRSGHCASDNRSVE